MRSLAVLIGGLLFIGFMISNVTAYWGDDSSAYYGDQVGTYNNGYPGPENTYNVNQMYSSNSLAPVGYMLQNQYTGESYYPTQSSPYGYPDAYIGNGPNSDYPYGYWTNWNVYGNPVSQGRMGLDYGMAYNIPAPYY